ncbi:helix-turn-helix domain-containing protein [Nocardiopsis sp. FR26]|uniref:helix-turn-helix domain-containing protein n=1 Tax=Nocardiopsis sp. FR26 TaxID=2605987 RepID=UPI001F3377E7|nr:helix-turn-helix domain-containing protein [Nocardiopsis sp. FR26]
MGWKPFAFKEAREAKGWNHSELAKRTGLSRTVVGRYEKADGSAPTPEALQKLAAVLSVPPREFIDFRIAGLAGYRAVLGLTQDQLVEKVGDPDLNVQTYRALEAGRTRKLRTAQARSLATFFKISEDEVRTAHEHAVTRRQADERLTGEGAERTR